MKYFLYARKSTDEDDKQLLSIEAQLEELREHAAREKPGSGLRVRRVEDGEGAGASRLQRHDATGGAGRGRRHSGLASRPPGAQLGGRRADHLRFGHGQADALEFPRFGSRTRRKESSCSQIAFGQSKYYVDNLSENVKRGIRQKLRLGWFPGRAAHRLPERAAPAHHRDRSAPRGDCPQALRGLCDRRLHDLRHPRFVGTAGLAVAQRPADVREPRSRACWPMFSTSANSA